VAREVPPAPAEELRDLADLLRGKLGSGVVVLGARGDGKVSLVAAVSADLASRVHAGELVKAAAPPSAAAAAADPTSPRPAAHLAGRGVERYLPRGVEPAVDLDGLRVRSDGRRGPVGVMGLHPSSPSSSSVSTTPM
jgi:hypothetical protein